MGILDALYAQTPQGDQLRGGLLGLSAGLLSGSVGNGGQFAPAMGRGLMGFQGGMQNAQDNQLRQQQLQQQQQLRDLQARKINGEMAQQEQFGKFFGAGQPSGGAQAMPVDSAGNAMASRIQQAINSGNPMLVDWGFKAAQAAQKQGARRTQFDPNNGLLIDLDAGTASQIMGPGGALQPKDDLVWDSARGGFVNKKNMAFNPAIGPDGRPVPAQNILEKPLTEGQSKDLLFGKRAQQSNDLIAQFEKDKVGAGLPSQIGISAAGYDAPNWLGPIGSLAEGIVNTTTGYVYPEAQKFDQAKRNFVNSILRKESGAVISSEEFANAEKQYFPQPGDTAEVLKQKALNRKLAVDGILTGVPAAGRDSLQIPVGGNQPSSTSTPSSAAITHLRSNPNLRSAFDAKYGAGASARVLGQ